MNHTVRRSAFALVLGMASLVSVNALAQTTAKPATASSGVTGTDPVPPSCGCKQTTPTTTTSSTTTAPSSTASAAQALLLLLGLA